MASDPRDWMWERARTILDEAERIEREFARAHAMPPSWAPAIDVIETAGELIVLVAVPGVDPSRIEVAIVGPRLVVSGERDVPSGLQGGAIVHRMEIPRGRFERRVALPPGRYEVARREHVHGCLAVAFKKL